MKKKFIPLFTLILFSLLACSNINSSGGGNSSSGDQTSNSGETSGGPFLVLNLPQTFVYKEIEYNLVKHEGILSFDENELIAVMINPEDAEKFLSENHDCDYIVIGSIYNYDDENNRLYLYQYEDYDISEYLVVFTNAISFLFEGESKI